MAGYQGTTLVESAIKQLRAEAYHYDLTCLTLKRLQFMMVKGKKTSIKTDHKLIFVFLCVKELKRTEKVCLTWISLL